MRQILRVTRMLLVAAACSTTAWAGALVQVTGASPFTGCTADDVGGQPGTNYLHSEVEPWIVVNPKNPSHIVGGWQQDRWSNGGSRGHVAGVSFDGGLTWARVVVPGITLCSGGSAGNGGDFKRATDPWLTFARNGELYFFSLALDIETPPDRPGGNGKNAMFVSKSTDGGLTWGDPVKIAEDTLPRFLNDKNAITADPGDANYVYAVWDRLKDSLGSVINPEKVFGLGYQGPAYFARTTDGGQSWEPARAIYNPAANNQTIGNQIVVLPDGTLLDFFNEILNFRNDDGGAHFDFNLAFVRSPDKGASWTRGPAFRAAKMQSMALLRTFGVIDPDTGDGLRTADLLPAVTVDRNSGTLYAVWQDARFSNFSYDEIAFAMSTDGGFTWTAPIKINQTPTNVPPGNRQAFTPSVHVAGDGTVGVTYYDFRNNTTDPTTLPTDYFLVRCQPSVTVSCATTADWDHETRLTDASFDMRKAPVARGFFLGDYEGLGSAVNAFVAFFSMPHGADPASVFFRRVGP